MITVTGTLSDAGGVALPCALLELRVLRSAGETFFNSTVQVKTDNDGNYNFSLKRGEYEVFAQVSRRSDVERIGTCVVNDGVQGELTLEELMALTSPLLPESVIEVRGHMDEVRVKHTEIHQWHGETAQSKEAITRLEQQTLQHNNEAQASAAISQAQAALSTAEREEAGRQASVAQDAVSTATLKANESAQHAQFSSQHRQASEGAQLASEVAANKAQGHEHQASSLLQQTTSQAHAASESALAVSGVELRVSEAEQRVAQHVLATQKNKEDAQIAAGGSASSASKSESHALGAADKLASAISQANRATTEADRAEAAASSVDEMLYAMSVAEFEARREANKRKYAGSGSLHNPRILNTVAQGVKGALYFPADTANTFIHGENEYNVNGVVFTVEQMNIKLPPAPDGTKTYDSATGEVMDFTKDVDPKYGDVAADRNEAVARAFEGLIKNGDFRNGGSWWALYDGASVANEKLTLESGEIAYAFQPNTLPQGTEVEVEVVVESVSGVLVIRGGCSVGDALHIKEAGTYKVRQITSTYDRYQLNLNTSSSRAVVSTFSVRPVTNQVITSRKDLVFLEVWDEVAHGDKNSKGVIYPLGNVQYGLSMYEGIHLQNNNVAQGYSAFGKWDTATRGYSARISDLTFAQLCKFLQDPRNNLRYDAETRKLIQTRYRIRVVEGVGDDWIGLTTSKIINTSISPTMKPNVNFAVYPQGESIIPSGIELGDYRQWYTNNLISDVDYRWGEQADVGLYTPRYESDRAVSIIIALVQRMNQGAYHPVYNVIGCRRFNLVGVWANYPWYLNNAYRPSSVAECFPTTLGNPSTDSDYGAFTNSGAIGQDSGRQPNDPYPFYDAIYAGQVEDLRLSAHKQGLNRLCTDAIQRAVAGKLRGKGRVSFSKFNTSIIGTGTHPQVSSQYSLSGFLHIPVFMDGDAAKQMGIDHGDIVYVVDNATGNYLKGDVRTGPTESDYIYIDKDTIENHGMPSTGTGLSLTLIVEKALSSEFDILPCTDIIGKPVHIETVFPNGVYAKWLSTIPEGVSKRFTLNRPVHGNLIGGCVYTKDDGLTWIAGNENIYEVSNSFNSSFPENAVALIHYKSLSQQTKAESSSIIMGEVGHVVASGGFYAKHWGNRLMQSLIGKVGVSGVGYTGAGFYPLTRTAIGLIGQPILHGGDPTLHSDLVIPAPDNASPGFKALYTLTEKNGLLYMQFHGRELKHDGTDWGDDNTIPIINGEGTMTDDNGQVVKTFCHHTLFPLGIASYTDSAMATE